MADDLIKVLRAAATGTWRADADKFLFDEAASRLEICERQLAQRDGLLAALKELEAAIERRWEGETQRKRENAVSPRTEDALEAARAAIKSAEA